MTREEMIDEYLKITDVNKDIAVIYDLMDKLGLKYKKTACKRCRKDFKNLIAEELGLIDNAAEESDFNGENYEYEYLLARPQSWNGHLMDQDTPVEIVREFVKQFPTGYYRKVERPVEVEETDNNTDNNE